MITPRQCKMARGALDLSLRQVCEAIGHNMNTVIRFEAGNDLRASIRDKIEILFTNAGIVFHPDGRTVTDTREETDTRKAA